MRHVKCRYGNRTILCLSSCGLCRITFKRPPMLRSRIRMDHQGKYWTRPKTESMASLIYRNHLYDPEWWLQRVYSTTYRLDMVCQGTAAADPRTLIIWFRSWSSRQFCGSSGHHTCGPRGLFVDSSTLIKNRDETLRPSGNLILLCEDNQQLSQTDKFTTYCSLVIYRSR